MHINTTLTHTPLLFIVYFSHLIVCNIWNIHINTHVNVYASRNFFRSFVLLVCLCLCLSFVTFVEIEWIRLPVAFDIHVLWCSCWCHRTCFPSHMRFIDWIDNKINSNLIYRCMEYCSPDMNSFRLLMELNSQ